MDPACIRTLQPASLSRGASLTPRLWLGGALSWDHPSGPALSRSTTHPHSGHISARTWSFQAMGRKKCLPNSMRRPQLFCTYREKGPTPGCPGTGTTPKNQGTDMGTGATSPGPRVCAAPLQAAGRSYPPLSSAGSRSPRWKFTNLQANVAETQSPLSQMHCFSRVHSAWGSLL